KGYIDIPEATSAAHPRSPDPGLVQKIFPNTEFFDPAARGTIVPTVAIPDRFARHKIANFSIEWIGNIDIPVTGTYSFATESDDGSMLYLDDKLLVDNGGIHPKRLQQASIYLNAGLHSLRERYLNGPGAGEMRLLWAPPGDDLTDIP